MQPSHDTTPAGPRWPALRRWLARLVVRLAVLMVLAAVFMAYLNPHRVVELANWAWACF